MVLLLSHWNMSWKDVKNTNVYSVLYKFPHSLFCLFYVPKKYREIYALHILLDILSHTGEWSIQPFFPSEVSIHGVWDPINWK